MTPIDVLKGVIDNELKNEPNIVSNRLQLLWERHGMAEHDLQPLIKQLENAGQIKVTTQVNGSLILISKP